MNQKIYQIKQYVKHLKQAKSRLGHGVHSPFVYDLIEQVFNHEGQYYPFAKIEQLRQQLQKDKTIIEIEDFGAGSTQTKNNKRSVASIAKSALLNAEHSQLLFRLVNRFQPKNIIELGTSLGTTSAYLASACKESQVYTFEGSPEIAKVAERNFDHLKIKNIDLTIGEFDTQLATKLSNIDTVDFAFIDGNHRYEPTVKYFEMLLEKATPNSVFIFDDIYWSEGMTRAWKEIIARPEVIVSIDIYRMGIIFFRKENPKQDFIVRF